MVIVNPAHHHAKHRRNTPSSRVGHTPALRPCLSMAARCESVRSANDTVSVTHGDCQALRALQPTHACRDARTPLTEPASRMSVRSHTPATGRTPEVNLTNLDVDAMLSPNTITPGTADAVTFASSALLNGHLGHVVCQVRRCTGSVQ